MAETRVKGWKIEQAIEETLEANGLSLPEMINLSFSLDDESILNTEACMSPMGMVWTADDFPGRTVWASRKSGERLLGIRSNGDGYYDLITE